MDQTIIGAVLVVAERLHESSGHTYPGIIFVQIDSEFENPDNDDENKKYEATAASAAQRARQPRRLGRRRREEIKLWLQQRRPSEATDERVHGVVARSATQDGAGEPEDAQLGDQQAAGCGVEVTE